MKTFSGFFLRAWLLTQPALAAGLNDTGISRCGGPFSNDLGCPVADYPNQDAEQGRDAQAAAGTLVKTGGGDAGFDYTKLDANGNALPASAGAWNCVRDNVTGLVWEIKTDDGGLHDKNNTYTWYQPDDSKNGGFAGHQNGGSCSGSSCDTNSYVNAVNAQGWCGAGDWRMPSRMELVGLIHNGRYPAPAIDSDYFPDEDGSGVWSGSPSALSLDYAWDVTFYFGSTSNTYKYYGYHVRLVRGGQ